MKHSTLVTLALGIVAAILLAAYFLLDDKGQPNPASEPDPVAQRPPPAPPGRSIDHAPVVKPELIKTRSGFVPAVWDTTIEFPNGTKVDVQMKTWQPDPPPFTGWKKLVNAYDALVKEAEAGSPAAARELYRELKNCEEAHTDEASFQSALEYLKKERIQLYPTGERSKKPLHGDDLVHAEEMMRERFIRCEGITPEHQENKIQWAEMAAHGGDFLSMRTMAREHGFTPEGLYWYEQGWLAGHASAADAMSIWFRNGAADPENQQPDHLRSYAYLYVNYKIYAAALARSSSPNSMNRIVSMENVVRGLGSYLSPKEQEQAEALAAQLLKENTNCCLGGWNVVSR